MQRKNLLYRFFASDIISLFMQKGFGMKKKSITKEEALEILLKNYKPFYNITMVEESQKPLTALCEFYEQNEKYILSKKANLYTTKAEEFLYLFDVDHLTEEIVDKWIAYCHEDGMNKANIGPDHMYTYITLVFVCNTCDPEAAKKIKKCRIYKSFHFSLHGWMDVHATAITVSDSNVVSNASGRQNGKILKKVLFS